ncbi:unnamed protein product [marine sediment metagenome]|uniref:Uncharacterized protein n=1 Tax=marine sediment metagenome TaxID=412755 RepID=X1JRD3_9ZZZZ
MMCLKKSPLNIGDIIKGRIDKNTVKDMRMVNEMMKVIFFMFKFFDNFPNSSFR